ncbi:MAG TPA: hypothetical protein VMW71_04065 [Thermoplasmata archaeon]|nr:hypothetical protein [Thermoplasmata archaeon]
MGKIALGLLSAVIAGLLMVPSSVSAKTLSIEVEDRIGDVAPLYTADTYDYVALYGDHSPIVKAGYFDMKWFLFSQKGSTYTFGMEMVGDLPQEGDPLPQGVELLQYTLWLDQEAWDWLPYSGVSYFIIVLQYDGLSYYAALYEYVSGDEVMELPFTVSGPRFEVRFSADSIANIPAFWLYPSVIVCFGNCPLESFVDLVDYTADAPGQVYTSIQWPSPES